MQFGLGLDPLRLKDHVQMVVIRQIMHVGPKRTLALKKYSSWPMGKNFWTHPPVTYSQTRR